MLKLMLKESGVNQKFINDIKKVNRFYRNASDIEKTVLNEALKLFFYPNDSGLPASISNWSEYSKFKDCFLSDFSIEKSNFNSIITNKILFLHQLTNTLDNSTLLNVLNTG